MKNKNMFKMILIIFFITFPIFDIIYLYSHVTTLIRVFLLLFFALVTFWMHKESKKDFAFLLSYYLALLGFWGIEILYSRGFNSLVPSNFSAIMEATTLLKLSMPFTILYILKYQELSRKDFFLVIKVWIFMIAGSIVFFNICGFSLSSYTDQITRYSIFSWSKSVSVLDSATKGFFAVANQEAVLLLMLEILSIYGFLYDKKNLIVNVILVVLACLMLGTRVSTYGGILSFITFGVLYLVFNLFFKEKISKRVIWLLPIFMGWCLLLPISPNSNRVSEMRQANEHLENSVEKENDSNVFENTTENNNEPLNDYDRFVKLINKDIIGEQFYEQFYPFKYDQEFWMEIVENQNSINYNYRKIETAIVERMIEVDGRWSNKLFGITNSRIQNVGNLERDFVLHYYAFGIVGVMLTLSFYFYSIFLTFKNTIKTRTFIDFAILSCLCLFMMASFLSGNSINFLATIVPMAFVVSFSGKLKDC